MPQLVMCLCAFVVKYRCHTVLPKLRYNFAYVAVCCSNAATLSLMIIYRCIYIHMHIYISMKENIFRNKDRVLIGKRCAGMGLSQQGQAHSTHIRSVIASNANTSPISVLPWLQCMEWKVKRRAMKESAHTNTTEMALHSHMQILWLCSQILWLYYSEQTKRSPDGWWSETLRWQPTSG